MDTINILAGIHFIVELINEMIVSRDCYLSVPGHLHAGRPDKFNSPRTASEKPLIISYCNPLFPGFHSNYLFLSLVYLQKKHKYMTGMGDITISCSRTH